jgi:hypothetical protein
METAVLEELRKSPSFSSWSVAGSNKQPSSITLESGQSFIYKGQSYTNLVVDEKHYSPADLAKAWGVSSETVRQIFRKEPGVLRLGGTEEKGTRGYVTLRIPQSVATRVHARLTALPQSR